MISTSAASMPGNSILPYIQQLTEDMTTLTMVTITRYVFSAHILWSCGVICLTLLCVSVSRQHNSVTNVNKQKNVVILVAFKTENKIDDISIARRNTAPREPCYACSGHYGRRVAQGVQDRGLRVSGNKEQMKQGRNDE
jgi:hypothetical protein